MAITTPSHVVEHVGPEKVKIRDVELFVGFVPGVDNPDDEEIAKFDDDRIKQVISRTNKMIASGQATRLIPDHNSDAQGASDLGSIGRIDNIRAQKILGGPGIIGDITMSSSDFEQFIASGRMPRRSSEIWPDGHLSEVALLGSRTPARPLPDMEFNKNGSAQRFDRPATRELFAMPTDVPHDPGMSSGLPTDDDNRKGKNMPDERDTKISDLEAKLKAAREEIAELRKGRNERDQQDAERFDHAVSAVKETFEKHVATLTEQNAVLHRERFADKAESMRRDGYGVPDEDGVSAVIERCMKADNPAAEYEFLSGMWAKPGMGQDVARHAQVPSSGNSAPEKIESAAKFARDKCLSEGKPEMFDTYYAEALEK